MRVQFSRILLAKIFKKVIIFERLKKHPAMKFRWFRNFLKGCSLTAALFVFQACYGTPQGMRYSQIDFNFEILDSEGKPVDKAKVFMKDNSTFTEWSDSVQTGGDGLATLFLGIYGDSDPKPIFRIEAEGYQSVDTVANSELLNADVITITLNKAE